MERIKSRKDPRVKEAAALLKSSEARQESGQFLCEGARLCEDAARSDIKIVRCFVTATALEKYESYLALVRKTGCEMFLVEDSVAQLLSSTKTPQGVFCVCELPKWAQGVIGGVFGSETCLVLENLQDPGNLGTILRTAEALGVFHVILLGEGCDPFSPKVLRASMGAVFRMLPMISKSPAQLQKLLKGNGFTLHAAVPSATAVPVTELVLNTGKHAVFIGNEGNGLTEETIALCDDSVTIPMGGRAESLNASAAANILLWELSRGRTSP